MNKINTSPLLLLFVLFLSIVSTSCKKEFLTKEPEPFFDKGNHLVLDNNLVILDNSELTHSGGQPGILYDSLTTVLKLDETTLDMELDSGLVLHIDMDDYFLLRQITKVEKANGGYVLQTTHAGINDVFDNATLHFDFDPGYSNQQLKSKSLSGTTGDELSKALTDNTNSIHPSEIKMIIGNTEKVIFSVDKDISLLQTKSANIDKRWEFGHQFDAEMTFLTVGPVNLKLKDFGFTFKSDISADYKISDHISGVTNYIDSRFDINVENTDINAWFDVAAVVEHEYKLPPQDVSLLAVPIIIQFEFPVGCVPVIMAVKFGLSLGVEISADGKVQATTGYTVEYNIPKISMGVSSEATQTPDPTWRHPFRVKTSETFETHSNFVKGQITKSEFHPLKLEAMATVKQAYTLKPNFAFSVYRIAGPVMNLAVGAEFDFGVGAGVSFSLKDSEAPKAYIGWDAELTTKVGIGGGIWLDFFGAVDKNLAIPAITIFPSIPIWHTPGSMVKKANNDFGHTIVGQAKEVEVEVKDSWTLPAPGMFVEWESEGGGHWELPITMTALGTTKNKWIPTEAGTYNPSCYVKDGKLKVVDRVTFTTTTVAQ